MFSERMYFVLVMVLYYNTLDLFFICLFGWYFTLLLYSICMNHNIMVLLSRGQRLTVLSRSQAVKINISVCFIQHRKQSLQQCRLLVPLWLFMYMAKRYDCCTIIHCRIFWYFPDAFVDILIFSRCIYGKFWYLQMYFRIFWYF